MVAGAFMVEVVRTANTRVDRLARQLLDDRAKHAARAKEALAIPACFVCERTYTPKPDSEGSTRFCSPRCREAFDAGFPPGSENPGLHPELMPNLYGHAGWRVVAGPPGIEVGSLTYAELLDRRRPGEVLRRSYDGVLLACRGCGRQFVSKGLRCCSAACEHRLHEQAANAALMAEVGMEVAAKRKCQECGADIPRWTGVGTKRRQVPVSTRFCSQKCRRRAWKRPGAKTVDLDAEWPRKPLCRSGSPLRIKMAEGGPLAARRAALPGLASPPRGATGPAA
jgi:ribosomal protein L24E